MASESKSPAELSAIPNNVSGDGTTFVRGLKRFLRAYARNVEEIAFGSERTVVQVTDLVLREQHINGKSNILVAFNKDVVTDYNYAEIWVSSSTNSTWKYNGSTDGNAYSITDVSPSTTYYVKVISCNKNNDASSYSDAPTAEIHIKGDSYICNAPVQFYWDNIEKKWYWTGYIDNNYTNFFEVRLDTNVGAIENKLGTVGFSDNINYLDVEPPVRMGTAYLYVCNTFGTYNTPATHIFNLSPLPKPDAPRLEKGNDGLIVKLDVAPPEATSYVVEVNGEEFEIAKDKQEWTYYDYSGELTVRYCFVDSTGKGVWSEPSTIIVGAYIQPSNVARNSITADKIASYAITSEKISSGAITTDKLGAKAITSDKIDAGAVRAENLSANSVHASHLYGENIDLTGELAIVGGAVLLNENGLRVTNLNNGDSVMFDTNGMTFLDMSGNTYANVGRMIIGQAEHGQRVVFNTAWSSAPHVVVMPQQFQSNIAEYSTANLEVISKATNITNEGFTISCFTRLLGGSTGANNGFSIGSATGSGWAGSHTVQIGTTKTVTVPQGATHIVINCEATYKAPHREYSNEGEYTNYAIGSSNVIFEVLVNGSSAQSVGLPTIAWDGSYNTYSTQMDINFPQGATLEVKAYLSYWVRGQFTEYGGYYYARASAKVLNYEFDIASGYEQFVGAGKATFIALESINANYTIE